MKKLFYTLLFALIPSAVWAVDAQTYTDPSQLPAAFTMTVNRHDYRGTDNNGDPILVNVQNNIVVSFDPESYFENTSTHVKKYGKLRIENFYSNDALVNSATLEFENRLGRNFRWDSSENKIYFSFLATYFSRSKTTSPYSSAYGVTSPYNSTYAFVARTQNSKSSYWMSGEECPYAYFSSPCECVLDLTTKTIEINQRWGVFLLKNQSGGQPSFVLEYFDKSSFFPTTLNDIVTKSEEGDDVIVADNLLCVAFLPQYSYDNEGNKTLLRNVLVCKDLGKYANPDVNTAGAFDYMHETGVFQREYDQSNWVVLTDNNNLFTSTSIPGTYINHIIKGGTIKGTFTDKRNPTIALSQLPTAAAVQTYTPNTYVVPSFNDAYAEQGSDVFFVRPKPQEYCQVMWANYDAGTDAFYVPTADDGNNVHNLSGGFAWEKTYLNMGTPTGNTVYTFFAMVNKVAPASESYCVWMHALNWESNLVEDQNNYVYAVMGGKEIFGSWPGKRLSLMRKAYDSAGNATNWYYINLGTEKQEGDLIIFSRNGSNQCEKITNFQLGNNFYNYWMDGYGDRYETLTGFSPTAPAAAGAPRRVATAEPDLSGGISESYVVMPLSLDSSSVLTGISTMRHDAEPVQTLYYSPTGLVSSSAFGGINIVVTRYTDGTTQARKVVIP